MLSVRDAERFIRAGNASRFIRVVIEPLEDDVDAALALGAEMESIIATAEIDLPQLHHGVGIASWAIRRRALTSGHDIRTGLEDTNVLPDGTPAGSNAELTAAAAAAMITSFATERCGQ
ncbi:3-keto-5-aminohexanoate cleavage protein [Rhodococcoides yunnanense]|uniref:3-keto-5-aminohexanoate cleavage protein n=1 Tax=Rhodococcoides yunnanense TaxID=278209 RepID=A0ABU4B8U2_9NOCA|nr:3-keto-5-aminohexanoate cleavage protein [Rhodococcus yunnanensis]MDV6260597.1 3-keto-5-aminohexanoate cleavage protein [Rhodococcus yunnanensis]